ncbi:hypothetical protein DCS_01391 [Drechmeria coniospora]|uniref:Vegetative cell wall protein gp1 n=1 Tax=Drechmeria coniospora TaxID=98403 RepID=A0A151GT08_DRECN|nr:hypothetical protein DCS_01391 [Drechmeria coniospora]KYK60254.1 hypothetical protein DCS_01391 [Drechmeria coniospora]ODA80198.1 hypothetical protein RJ55_03156 [Drechmeria coniospora]
MSYPSPRTPGSTPIHDWEYSRMSSATPTPSPRPSWFESVSTPRRPATRAAHSRSSSYSHREFLPPRAHPESPRYNSSGSYLTADYGTYYVDAACARTAPYGPPYDAHYESPRPSATQARPPTSHSHARRSSASIPQRPAMTKPSNGQRANPPVTAKATEADARRHKIPQGFSLKNWDPNEEPILLLGSVFDANSLGKWIYDWTVFHKGGALTPIAEMAADLWLNLIHLTAKVKDAEAKVGAIRRAEDREFVEDVINAGERLMAELRALLKACEAPMLKACEAPMPKASRRKQVSLGKNSGVEFVETLFGRDRELVRTEKLTQKIRLFRVRFDANCTKILAEPTA